MNVQLLTPQLHSKYLSLRQLALDTEPLAFGLCCADIRADEVPNDRLVFVVEDKNELIAMAAICPERTQKRLHKAKIGEIFVKDIYRGKGISKLLMNELISKAKDAKLRKLQLTVNTNQTTAINLYLKFGFQPTGIMRDEICVGGRYYDMQVMELLL